MNYINPFHCYELEFPYYFLILKSLVFKLARDSEEVTSVRDVFFYFLLLSHPSSLPLVFFWRLHIIETSGKLCFFRNTASY